MVERQMGASGSAWIKPKKRKGLRPDAFDEQPHPRVVRVGQRYASLRGRAGALTIVKLLPDGERCEAKRDTPEGTTTARLKLASVLAATPEGEGRYYRLIGYAARRYKTVAQVVEIDEAWIRVICPEWHRRLPIAVAPGALAASDRTPGRWLVCTANLGAPTAARVEPERFAPVAATFDAALYPEPIRPEARPAPRAIPSSGEGCGDVVLFLNEEEAERARRGSEIYLTGHAPPARAGGRVYISVEGAVHGWREAAGTAPLPNGTRVRMKGEWRETRLDTAGPSRPAAGVVEVWGRQRWAWRDWLREAEAQPQG